MKDIIKWPRVFVDQALALHTTIPLAHNHVHYFKTVLRRQVGDNFRIFNGRDGEFSAEITQLGKKSGQAVITNKYKDQPVAPRGIHLLFAPIKKQRMDILIEKSVELGVTHFHPVLTAQTNIRKINEARLQAQIIEATEQCERMTMPVLHPLVKLEHKIQNWDGPNPIQWCFERSDAAPLKIQNNHHVTFLIGPVGGFTQEESHWLTAHKNIKTISLGTAIYRVETAAFIFLARLL